MCIYARELWDVKLGDVSCWRFVPVTCWISLHVSASLGSCITEVLNEDCLKSILKSLNLFQLLIGLSLTGPISIL